MAMLGVGCTTKDPRDPWTEPARPKEMIGAEGPVVEPVAGDPVAELVRVEGKVKVNDQVRSVGAPLKEGDRVSVPAGGIAVVEYQDGCRDTVEGGEDYSVNHAYCICRENLDASKHSRHDAIAELRDINGKVLVNTTLGTEGMELKENDRVTVGDVVPDEDSAMVEYYFGCDYKVKVNETYTVNAEECCKALLLPPPVLAPPPAGGPSILSIFGTTIPEKPGPAGPEPILIPKGVPSSHTWQYLYPYEDEKPGYATYSYILAGRSEYNQQATSLYDELIKAILGSTPSATDLAKHDIPKSRLNLFLIPVVESNSATHAEPDYKRSMALLAALSAASPLNLSGPGPYIITLYQPISAENTNDTLNILYADLSSTHIKAIPEIVRTYKRIVVEEKPNGIEKMNPLHLSLLNAALLTEDSIEFAKAAYAKIRNAFLK